MGLGAGHVVCWSRRVVLRYTQLLVGKGDVWEWRRTLGVGKTFCRLCGVKEEISTHLVFGCEECHGLQPLAWTSWEELDDRKKWRYTVEGEGGKVVLWDRVEHFFGDLDRVIAGVG